MGEVVGCKFVVASCDTPILLDLVEEPLHRNRNMLHPWIRTRCLVPRELFGSVNVENIQHGAIRNFVA